MIHKEKQKKRTNLHKYSKIHKKNNSASQSNQSNISENSSIQTKDIEIINEDGKTEGNSNKKKIKLFDEEIKDTQLQLSEDEDEGEEIHDELPSFKKPKVLPSLYHILILQVLLVD